MSAHIYSVTCFTRALVSPGYTPEADDRWLDCHWGTYTSQKCAELAIFREFLKDPNYDNYKIFYEEDIPRQKEGKTKYATGDYYDYETLRVVVTIKDHGIPVMETTACIIESVVIPQSNFEKDYPEEFQQVEQEVSKSLCKYSDIKYKSMFADWVHGV